MNYNSSLDLSIDELKHLWVFLDFHRKELSPDVSGIMVKIEKVLWEKLSLEELDILNE